MTGRFTHPDEVADLVLFLASDRAANVTGADFRIDGGLSQRCLKGRFLGLVLGTIGRRVLEKALDNTIKAIEARSSTTRSTEAA